MSYFSRITLRPGIAPQRLVALLPTTPYDDHRLLWRLFPHAAETERFLFRRVDGSGRLRYFVVSEQPPEPTVDELHVETKPYDPQLGAGRRLAFSLRVNPVVSRRDEAGRLHRHDLVMDAKRGLKDGSDALPSMAALSQEAGSAWLARRTAELGFAVAEDGLVVEAYRPHRFRKRNGHPVSFSALDLSGVLQVTHPEPFRRSLVAGVGPAKAFGCGLLLVRPVA